MTDVNKKIEEVLSRISSAEQKALLAILAWEEDRMWQKSPSHKEELAVIIEREIK